MPRMTLRSSARPTPMGVPVSWCTTLSPARAFPGETPATPSRITKATDHEHHSGDQGDPRARCRRRPNSGTRSSQAPAYTPQAISRSTVKA